MEAVYWVSRVFVVVLNRVLAEAEAVSRVYQPNQPLRIPRHSRPQGNSNVWGSGAGKGPWVMADLENGLWAGNERVNQNYPSITGWNFVTGMVKGGTNGFALKGATSP